jgi:hypothetical protein
MPVASVPVGLEPVAVAARTNTEVWSSIICPTVSVVDLGRTPPAWRAAVGDEPRDIVLAGPTDAAGHFSRAFITTARRGQNCPSPSPELTTPASRGPGLRVR